jgi:hypothetical protein
VIGVLELSLSRQATRDIWQPGDAIAGGLAEKLAPAAMMLAKLLKHLRKCVQTTCCTSGRKPKGVAAIYPCYDFAEERARALDAWEPGIDRAEKIVGLLPFALIAPQPRQANRRAQFPGLCLLPPRNGKGALEICCRFFRAWLEQHQCDFSGGAIHLGLAPSFLGRFHQSACLADGAPGIIELTELRVGSRHGTGTTGI